MRQIPIDHRARDSDFESIGAVGLCCQRDIQVWPGQVCKLHPTRHDMCKKPSRGSGKHRQLGYRGAKGMPLR
jgi:hypothetical protein